MTVAYVTMPGTSGNYVSSADVNLLDADTAHCYQTFGTWANGSNMAGTRSKVAEADAWSGYGCLNTASVTGVLQLLITLPAFTATAATQYSASVKVKLSHAITPNLTLRMRWENSGGTLISYSTGPAVTSPVAAGEEVVLTVTGTSPALTALCELWVYFDAAGGTLPVSGTATVYDAVFRLGATSTFVPSLRIVGDLDMRARFAATDATPATAETLIGQRSGNSGYAMTLGTGGELVVYHGTGSGTRVETSSGLSLVAATDTEVQSTLDISAGTWTHYKNGVQFDTSGSFATTAGSPYAGPLAVGADSAGTSGNWDGDIYYAEVRDGIDGPVVRRFDADDLIGLV